MSLRRPQLSLCLMVLCIVTACSTSPTGRTQLTLFPSAEIDAMGDASYAQMKDATPVLPEGEVTAYVRCVAQPLLRQVGGDWEITVFHDDQVNAFALPGNNIGIYTGLLGVASNQHQLAAVVGHEIGHVLAEHANARLSTSFATQAGLDLLGAVTGSGNSFMGQQVMAALGVGAQIGILLPFSRGQESEADIIGLQMMADAGFDPREAVQLWRNMEASSGGNKPPELLSTHPASQTRIQRLEAAMPDALARFEAARRAGRRPDCSLL
ncbi:MAG: M48 family metallopeptidase [Pseudomonadales bacterium]|jgi:predicted Zn-dependent protease|nr:M48 family metallopeptidase [Pseudomonadales bacterium]